MEVQNGFGAADWTFDFGACERRSKCLVTGSKTHHGKLVGVMAIGAESTGSAIEMIGDKQVNSIQVRYRSAGKLEKLTNKQVRPPVSSSAGKESKRVSSPFSTFPP